MVLVCYVFLQNHVIKGSCDFMVRPLEVSHHPGKFGGYDFCNSIDIMILICYLILQDHVIKESINSL